MARAFDGTNDNLLSADNAVSGADVDQKSMSAWVTRPGNPAAGQIMLMLETADGGSNLCALIHRVPAAAGYKLRLFHQFSVTGGDWTVSADISNTRHHVAVVYDRALATNDPLIYVDGVSVSIAEDTTPVGTVTTGSDTLKLGENPTAGQDLAASLENVAIGTGLWAAADVNRAMWWGRPLGGLVVYHPFYTDKLADQGSAAAALTATGTTVASLVSPAVRPGSAMMGMDVGW